MLEVLFIAAEALPDPLVETLSRYGVNGALVAVGVYLIKWGIPAIMEKWKELENVRAQNQKMLLDSAASMQVTSKEITEAQRSLTERLIVANERAEHHADNLERIVTASGQEGR